MAKSTAKPSNQNVKDKEAKTGEVKLPPLNFGQKQSIFSGGKTKAPNQFVPKTFRITQHKGGS